MSGAKFETYEPASLNCVGLFAPSPPNTFARLPCSSSCWPNVCASGGCCVGKNTTSASLGTRVTSDEKSVVFTDVDCRIVVTPFFLRTASVESGETDRVRLLEVDQHDLLRVELVDHEVRVGRPLDVVARARRGRTPAVASLFEPVRQRRARRRRRDVRDARREQRLARGRGARPTSPGRSPRRGGSRRSSSGRRRDPRRRPSRPACRRARAAPCSPSGLASRETAYCVQVSCSWPRKPAPPVSGVMMPILSVPLQLTTCDAVADDEPAPAVDAAIAAATAATSASTATARAFIPAPPCGIPM